MVEEGESLREGFETSHKWTVLFIELFIESFINQLMVTISDVDFSFVLQP